MSFVFCSSALTHPLKLVPSDDDVTVLRQQRIPVWHWDIMEVRLRNQMETPMEWIMKGAAFARNQRPREVPFYSTVGTFQTECN